jgi:membrane peptidoglycan carboxypeptidase
VAERKNVIHADVAYIMDDMMKDVINRGTATDAQAWGFKNVAGKTGFAGKTGTSRDGWFAGFTPELVTVVYVGFDDGDDLGMKGSDSAMPIWADFMRVALNEHPEWNGDWQMPDSVRRAEIDTRNGKLVRELTDADAESLKAQQTALKNSASAKADTNTDIPENTPDANIYVSDVPSEFRRVELFVLGTVPNKLLLPTNESITDLSETTPIAPSPTSTPFTTWQDAQQNPSRKQSNSAMEDNELEEKGFQQNITTMICPITGMRATSNCPEKRPQSFKLGNEPKEFCTFHVYPPKQ